MRAAKFGILLAVSSALACEPTHSTDTTAAVPPPTNANSPTEVAPSAPPPRAQAASPKPRSLAIAPGRYRGGRVCVELFANGDIHLNDVGGSPKVQVLGHATFADSGESVVATVEVSRIWKARFTSRCRKHNDLGDWTDSVTILGHKFTAGSHTLRLQRIDDHTIEVCAETCETLERQDSVLHGRWREPGLSGARDSTDNPIDEVIDLDVNEHGGVWLSRGPGKKWAGLSGPMTFKHLGGDRFTVTLSTAMVDTGKGVTAPPDSKWKPGAVLDLSITRMPGEHIEVCRTTADGGACTTLERMFDAFSHTVD